MKAVKLDQWYSVCTVSDLVPDSGICALVSGQQIAIFYVPSASPAIYAIGNWDPAGKANVLSRGITADIGGELTVASPLYKQHFSLSSGQCLEDETLSVPVFGISLDGDNVMVKV